jgi:hypothetical protein
MPLTFGSLTSLYLFVLYDHRNKQVLFRTALTILCEVGAGFLNGYLCGFPGFSRRPTPTCTGHALGQSAVMDRTYLDTERCLRVAGICPKTTDANFLHADWMKTSSFEPQIHSKK